MKLIAAFAFGFALVASVVWWPAPRYYVDTTMGVYHTRDDCPYGQIFAFASRERASDELPPCPFCVSPEGGDKMARHDSRQCDKKAGDEVPDFGHSAPQGAIGSNSPEP